MEEMKHLVLFSSFYLEGIDPLAVTPVCVCPQVSACVILFRNKNTYNKWHKFYFSPLIYC